MVRKGKSTHKFSKKFLSQFPDVTGGVLCLKYNSKVVSMIAISTVGYYEFCM